MKSSKPSPRSGLHAFVLCAASPVHLLSPSLKGMGRSNLYMSNQPCDLVCLQQLSNPQPRPYTGPSHPGVH